jgi:hypothetical protein
MSNTRTLALVLTAVALTACNPFHREPVTSVSRDANVNDRWTARLVTPAALAGAVQMNGTATMQPGQSGQDTRLRIQVANATPGGLHPWQVHYGRCGQDQGIFGSPGAYQTMRIGDDGRGETGATVAERTPTGGDFFVVVYASSANAETVVACGNLAAPAR